MRKWINKFLDWFYRKEEEARYSIPVTKTYVVALNYQHFQYWCNMVGYSVHANSLRYVLDPSVLYGVDGRYAKFVFYGPWRERKDANEIAELITYIEMTAR